MKDLLYLKDEQIKEFIQLLYYAYRETFSDPKEILSKKFFGPAHLRALNLIERNPGINLGELIFKLKVTKQSLNRVLRDLIKTRMIKQIQDDEDTRKKNLFLDKDGKIFSIYTESEFPSYFCKFTLKNNNEYEKTQLFEASAPLLYNLKPNQVKFIF